MEIYNEKLIDLLAEPPAACFFADGAESPLAGRFEAPSEDGVEDAAPAGFGLKNDPSEPCEPNDLASFLDFALLIIGVGRARARGLARAERGNAGASSFRDPLARFARHSTTAGARTTSPRACRGASASRTRGPRRLPSCPTAP